MAHSASGASPQPISPPSSQGERGVIEGLSLVPGAVPPESPSGCNGYSQRGPPRQSSKYSVTGVSAVTPKTVSAPWAAFIVMCAIRSFCSKKIQAHSGTVTSQMEGRLGDSALCPLETLLPLYEEFTPVSPASFFRDQEDPELLGRARAAVNRKRCGKSFCRWEPSNTFRPKLHR